MRDDSDTLEAYSYWTAEFIPYDTDDVSGTDSKSVKVNELCFSNMSNAGKYWSRGWVSLDGNNIEKYYASYWWD